MPRATKKAVAVKKIGKQNLEGLKLSRAAQSDMVNRSVLDVFVKEPVVFGKTNIKIIRLINWAAKKIEKLEKQVAKLSCN